MNIDEIYFFYTLGFGLFLLFLTWLQIYTGKTGGRLYTSDDLKSIKKEENPLAFKIRVYMTFMLAIILLLLSVAIYFT